MKKVLTTGVLAGALLVAATVPVLAASTGTFSISKTGVQFNSARYTWLAKSGCSGATEGYNYSGYLKDTASDGNGVFVHAKVDGYGYTPRIYNSSGSGSSLWVNRSNVHVTGDVCYHQSGKVEVCQDRGTLFADICGAKSFTR